MRKSVILMLTLIFLLTSCSKNVPNAPLVQLTDDYNLDEAKSDNCVVFEDGDVTYGQYVWKKFIKLINNGKSSTVRLAFYYTLGDPSHYSEELYEEIKGDYPVLNMNDLSFDGNKYTIGGFDDGKLVSKEYKYLVKYEGRPKSATAIFSEYTYYVLVNDNTVTWDDIEHGMVSSRFGDSIDHYSVYSDLVFK